MPPLAIVQSRDWRVMRFDLCRQPTNMQCLRLTMCLALTLSLDTLRCRKLVNGQHCASHRVNVLLSLCCSHCVAHIVHSHHMLTLCCSHCVAHTVCSHCVALIVHSHRMLTLGWIHTGLDPHWAFVVIAHSTCVLSTDRGRETEAFARSNSGDREIGRDNHPQ